MAISLYDVSIGTYLQILNSVSRVLKKGLKHCEKNDINPDELLQTQLYPDMLALNFQIASVVHHSLGAIKGVQAGEFSGPTLPELDYQGFQQLLQDTITELKDYSVDSITALEDNKVQFKMGGATVGKPIDATEFILRMSLPNFYFHATTAYDILRMKGVKIGKLDYIGNVLKF